MNLFHRPRITPGLPTFDPAPLVDPKDPDYVRAGVDYLIFRWNKQAEELKATANKMAESNEYDENKHDKELKYRVVAETLERAAWMLESVSKGRMEEVARGKISYPDPL